LRKDIGKKKIKNGIGARKRRVETRTCPGTYSGKE